MVDVFEQVEEELRSERYKRLARVWGPVVGGVLALALIAALGWWGWQSWQDSRASKASVAYEAGLEALQNQDMDAAKTAFGEAVDAGSAAYGALALMQQAGIAVSENRTTEAVDLFDRAARASRDPLIADAAALKAAFLVMDTAPIADIEGRLEPLTRDDRPFRVFAQEALALAKLQHGQTDEARALLVQLQLGQDAPDSVRQRAQVAIQAIDSGTAGSLAAIVQAQIAAEAASAPAEVPAPAGAQ